MNKSNAKICPMESCFQIKSLYSLYYAEACNELAGLISAFIAHERYTACVRFHRDTVRIINHFLIILIALFKN